MENGFMARTVMFEAAPGFITSGYMVTQYHDGKMVVDAFHYEYYVSVSDIIRDEYTGEIKEIVGEKVDRQTYEESEKALWNGEQIITLSVSDYDKIYSDDNLLESLGKCYLKNKQ